MRIVQLTPGAGAMYCGNCFRDHAQVRAWQRLGHDVVLLPLYLPVRLEDGFLASDTPVFFGGINVYLDHRWAWFRRAPAWLRRWLAAPPLLRWAGSRAGRTQAAELGALTFSMLHGEQGSQARDLEELIDWLANQPRPDLIVLSNVLLVGLARRLHEALGAPVVVTLRGEETFLDDLPDAWRRRVLPVLAERARELRGLIAPTRLSAARAAARLNLPPERVRVVPAGIDPEGLEPAPAAPVPPVLGFFARMSPAKGLDAVVEAFIALRRSGRAPDLSLKVGGGCGPNDEAFVASLKRRLADAGLDGAAAFHPNLDGQAKAQFLRSLSVFSAPAPQGESYGLTALEALACAVPVVAPAHGAWPELIEETGGGVLFASGSSEALASAIADLLREPDRARILGRKGRGAVLERFTADRVAAAMLHGWDDAPAHSNRR
jgi:glycosyltransferase involved in cell wall biosynthesis